MEANDFRQGFLRVLELLQPRHRRRLVSYLGEHPIDLMHRQHFVMLYADDLPA